MKQTFEALTIKNLLTLKRAMILSFIKGNHNKNVQNSEEKWKDDFSVSEIAERIVFLAEKKNGTQHVSAKDIRCSMNTSVQNANSICPCGIEKECNNCCEHKKRES